MGNIWKANKKKKRKNKNKNNKKKLKELLGNIIKNWNNWEADYKKLRNC